MTAGLAWVSVCAVLAALWTAGASWGSEDGTLRTAVRGILGGLGAVGAASGVYGVLQLTGLELRWELVEHGLWPAFGFAMAIGLVEETAKLVGIVLALSSRRPRDVFQATAAVAAVFALVEAALVLRGSSWPHRAEPGGPRPRRARGAGGALRVRTAGEG